jgi:hypothetical protein
VAAGNEMRVSDAERDAAAAELREHFASGRLDSGELDQRLTAVFAARTRGDLFALFTDLPSSGHGWSGPLPPPGGGRSYGPGPFGAGPFGARAADWDRWNSPGASGARDGLQARGSARRSFAGRALARMVLTSALIWALFVLGILGVFGIGAGRPLGIVLLGAAFVLLRRLVFFFFGRRGRRQHRGRGPRRRR